MQKSVFCSNTPKTLVLDRKPNQKVGYRGEEEPDKNVTVPTVRSRKLSMRILKTALAIIALYLTCSVFIQLLLVSNSNWTWHWKIGLSPFTTLFNVFAVIAVTSFMASHQNLRSFATVGSLIAVILLLIAPELIWEFLPDPPPMRVADLLSPISAAGLLVMVLGIVVSLRRNKTRTEQGSGGQQATRAESI